jgi:hypothetical protein
MAAVVKTTVGLLACAILNLNVGSAEARMLLLLLALAALGYLADRSIPRAGFGDGLDALLRSACLALVALLLIAAAVMVVPGAVDFRWLIGGLAALILVLTTVSGRQPAPVWGLSLGTLKHVLFLLVLGLPVRLVMLGFSELAGDEARVMNRAAGLFMGENGALTVHHKGPGELLLAMFWGGVVGRAAESDMRFPFALTGVVGVLAVYAAGRQLFSPNAGLVAATLWAINGYAIAFSRVIQYHSLVVLLTMTALLCAATAVADRSRARACSLLALVFLVAAGVCGFNMPILALPAILVLLGMLKPYLAGNGRGVLIRWAVAVLLICLLVGAGSLLMAPQVARELTGYALERVGQGQPFNNLDLCLTCS